MTTVDLYMGSAVPVDCRAGVCARRSLPKGNRNDQIAARSKLE